MSETKRLAAHILSIDYETLDPIVTTRARTTIRDYLGVALYGTTHDTGKTIGAYGMLRTFNGDASVLDGHTADPEHAALLNGTFGHAVDYDDTFASIPLHPTTVVFPATLAIGEYVDATGSNAVAAYVAGVETLFRVGHSVFPGQYSRGFHSTATVGPIGAAAAGSVLLDLSVRELQHAFGIAASSAGGLRKNFGSTTKPLHAGFAAAAGVRAALLAQEGATADPNILDGPLGYGHVMDEAYDTNDLRGSGFDAITDIGLKLYPSVHITHGSMEALRTLVAKESLDPTRVTSIKAYVHPGAADVLLHADPSDALQAKFSMQFCLAAVLRAGGAGLDEFTDEYVLDPATQEIMTRVAVEYSDAVADELGRYGGRVVVETCDGKIYEATAVDAPGSPHNPVEADRLRTKFERCVAPTALNPELLMTAVEDLADSSLANLTESLSMRS